MAEEKTKEYTVAEHRSVRYGNGPNDVAYEGDTLDLIAADAETLLDDGSLESDSAKAVYLQARRLQDTDVGVEAVEVDRSADLEGIDELERREADAMAFGTGGGANASNPDLTPEVIEDAKASAQEAEGGKAASRNRQKAGTRTPSRRATGEQGQNAGKEAGTPADPTAPQSGVGSS